MVAFFQCNTVMEASDWFSDLSRCQDACLFPTEKDIQSGSEKRELDELN